MNAYWVHSLLPSCSRRDARQSGNRWRCRPLFAGGGGFFSFTHEFPEQQPRDGIQRGKHALTGGGHSLVAGHTNRPVVQDVIEVVDRRRVAHVTLVVLQNVWDPVDVQTLQHKVVLQVAEALDVFLHFIPLRIGDEHDAVDAAKDELARGVVDDLAGDGVELEPFNGRKSKNNVRSAAVASETSSPLLVSAT